MRLRLLGMAVLACCSAQAQIPDLKVRLDLTFDYRTRFHGPDTLRSYSTLGRHSIVGFAFGLEPGFRAYVSQRLQRIDADPDSTLIDELYVEDEGIWRLGRQYLPFGSGEILRESVSAARAEQVFLGRITAKAAICDNGPGMQRGLVVRLGGPLGVSAAIGEHFGIAGTALTLVRRPEESPGKGKGYREALGIDYAKEKDSALYRGELVWLRKGETADDEDKGILDLSVSLRPTAAKSLTLGWTRLEPNAADFYRISAALWLDDNLAAEPLVRWMNGRFFDASIALRIRF